MNFSTFCIVTNLNTCIGIQGFPVGFTFIQYSLQILRLLGNITTSKSIKQQRDRHYEAKKTYVNLCSQTLSNQSDAS